MTGRYGYVAAVLSLASFGVAGPALAQSEGTPVRGGTAILALQGEPAGLNPVITSSTTERQIGCIIHHGLVEPSSDLSRILPVLAKSWTISPDGKTYTFDLVHTTWHDGKPFTSEDVKYTVLEVATKMSPVFAPAGTNIASIDTPAPDKVVFNLKDSFGPFLTALACEQGTGILPAHLFKGTDVKANPATTTAAVGTGAFKFAEWKHNEYVRLVRNPDYFQPGKPYLDAVIGKVIPLPSSRIQALAANEVDTNPYYPLEQVQALRSNANLQMHEMDLPPSMQVLFFNTKKKPFDDKRIRQALMMATDRDYLFKTAFFEVGKVGVQPFPTQIPWAANSDIDYRKMYPFDMAKANAALDAAGLKRGSDGKRFATKIAIWSTLFPEFNQVSQALKSMWGQVGVDVAIEALDTATMGQRVYIDMDFDITMVGYSSYADPALGVARTVAGASVGKLFGNPSGWSSAEVDKLLDQGSAATAFADRGVFYKKAQLIIADELPMLTLREYKNVEGSSKKLRGLWGRAESSGSWQDAWLEK